MKLGARLLKQLILEVLDEGKQERKWVKLQPEEEQESWLSAEQQGLKLSDLAWIKKVRGGEPIEDIIGDVLFFREESTQQKLKDNGFETNLSKKHYKSVNDLRRLLMNTQEADDLDSKDDNDLQDSKHVQDLGKVGKWSILMPITQKGSIACDISTKDTTWCTTKSKGQNLFYSYVGRKDEDIILFYVMDYSRTPNLTGKDADARLSIGFLNGQPVLKGQSGGLSVNAENNGVTEAGLRAYLGSDYDRIMSILQDKANEVGTDHPAKLMFKKAAQNPRLLKKLVKDYKPEEKLDFYNQVLEQEDVSPGVLLFLSKDGDERLRRPVAENPNTPPEILLALSRDENKYVRRAVARNPNTSPEILLVLSKDETVNTRSIVAENPNTPPEALLVLAGDRYEDVKENVAHNPNTPIQALLILSKDRNHYTRMNVAENPSTPPEVLLALSEDADWRVRSWVAKSPNAPPEALIALVKTNSLDVRLALTKNPNTPIQALLALSKDKGKRVRASVARNPNTPLEVLHVLADDREHYVKDSAELFIRKRKELENKDPKIT